MSGDGAGPAGGGSRDTGPRRSRAGRKKGLIIAAVVALAVALAAWGFLWVSQRSESFDRQYENCMSAREPTLHALNHYWPDDAYQQAMAECQGPPPPPSANPGSWRWP